MLYRNSTEDDTGAKKTESFIRKNGITIVYKSTQRYQCAKIIAYDLHDNVVALHAIDFSCSHKTACAEKDQMCSMLSVMVVFSRL